MIHKEDLNTFRTLCITAILMLVPVMLIESQPDLSTTITVAFVLCMLLYVSGLSYKIIGTVLAIVVPCAIVFFNYCNSTGPKVIRELSKGPNYGMAESGRVFKQYRISANECHYGNWFRTVIRKRIK